MLQQGGLNVQCFIFLAFTVLDPLYCLIKLITFTTDNNTTSKINAFILSTSGHDNGKASNNYLIPRQLLNFDNFSHSSSKFLTLLDRANDACKSKHFNLLTLDEMQVKRKVSY